MERSYGEGLSYPMQWPPGTFHNFFKKRRDSSATILYFTSSVVYLLRERVGFSLNKSPLTIEVYAVSSMYIKESYNSSVR